MPEQLFVYGTLMDPNIQQMVFGRTVPGQPDTLAGYRRGSVRLGVGVYPAIWPDGSSLVQGMVLQISQAELSRADRYETDAYQRIEVDLNSGRRVWVYCLCEEQDYGTDR